VGAEDEAEKLAKYLQKYWPNHIKEGTPVDNAIRLLNESLIYAELEPGQIVCPIMSRPHDGVDCIKKRCAWWHENEKCCAVPLIAFSLNAIGYAQGV